MTRKSKSWVFAAILRSSEHCTAAFFVQGDKNYTDVVLLYRLILGTYDDDCFYYLSWRNNAVIAFGTLSSFTIFVRKNNFLSPSVYCPDTSKRIPQIVTATESE